MGRVADRPGGVAVGAGREWRHPEHEADAARVHGADQAGGVGKPARVEGELPVAGLPGVVDENPPDRDLRGLQAGDVLEHLVGAGHDVAPLDQGELGGRRHGGPARVGLVVGEGLGQRADVEALVEPRRLDADLGAVGQRRELARGLRADLAALPAGRPGEGKCRGRLARDPDAPARGAREERDWRVAALVAHLDGEDLPAKVGVLAVLAAAEEVVGRGRQEGVVDLLDVGRRVKGELDAGAGRRPGDGDCRRPPGLVGGDLVHAPLGRGHVRERVDLSRRGELVAKAPVLALGDDGLPVVEDAHEERLRVDVDRDAVRRGARAATAERGHGGEEDQPAHTSAHATSRSALSWSRPTGRRRRASSTRVALRAVRLAASRSS